jgi:multidrug efflux pump subunit AcrA (membrane-fusion protein)
VAVRLAKKALAVATTEYERAQALNAGLPGTVSERELNVLRLTRDKSELEIENATQQQVIAQLTKRLREADAEIARVEQQRCTISAPISGMVVHVEKHAGEWVEDGGLVARIVSVGRIRAEGYVSDSQAAQRLVGWKGILDLPADGTKKSMEGEVVFVSPEANPVDGRVRVWIDFDNRTAQLRPGQPASVRLVAPSGSL